MRGGGRRWGGGVEGRGGGWIGWGGGLSTSISSIYTTQAGSTILFLMWFPCVKSISILVNILMPNYFVIHRDIF